MKLTDDYLERVERFARFLVTTGSPGMRRYGAWLLSLVREHAAQVAKHESLQMPPKTVDYK